MRTDMKEYWETYSMRMEAERNELLSVLQELVDRCDGDEGVRADGSNIQTIRANALLAKLAEEVE